VADGRGLIGVRALVIVVATGVLAGCHRKPKPAGPPGDCAAVAEALASLDVGNYAPVDQRAPVVARYGDACDDAAVTVAEARCITTAKDAWTAKGCVPRMFPELAAGHDDGACKQIVDRLRASVLGQVAPALAGWANRELDIEQAACVEDGWPDAVKACLLGSGAAQACAAGLPAPLQAKLQARLVAAMKTGPGTSPE
jgi:hypothetical protein